MSKKITPIWPMIALVVGVFVANPSFAAEDYYRWVGEDGVIHYGSRPPEGVEATKISTYGKSAAENAQSTASAEDASLANMTEQQKEVVAERREQCNQEKQRLSALRTPGRRIRMEQPDGTSRYLTPEEVAKEISASEAFVSQACK